MIARITLHFFLYTSLLFAWVNRAHSHPYHHSLAIIDYNQDAQQFEISLKLLTEDFKYLQKNKSIKEYIDQHLTLTIEDTQLTLEFQGQEISVENTWLYMSVGFNCQKLSTTQTMILNDTLLYAKNPNQFNTIKITVGNRTSSHNFSSKQSSHVFNLEGTHLNCPAL